MKKVDDKVIIIQGLNPKAQQVASIISDEHASSKVYDGADSKFSLTATINALYSNYFTVSSNRLRVTQKGKLPNKIYLLLDLLPSMELGPLTLKKLNKFIAQGVKVIVYSPVDKISFNMCHAVFTDLKEFADNVIVNKESIDNLFGEKTEESEMNFDSFIVKLPKINNYITENMLFNILKNNSRSTNRHYKEPREENLIHVIEAMSSLEITDEVIEGIRSKVFPNADLIRILDDSKGIIYTINGGLKKEDFEGILFETDLGNDYLVENNELGYRTYKAKTITF